MPPPTARSGRRGRWLLPVVLTALVGGALAILLNGPARASATPVAHSSVSSQDGENAPAQTPPAVAVINDSMSSPSAPPTAEPLSASALSPTGGVATTAPCSGEDCIPQPTDTPPATTAPPTPNGTGTDGGGSGAGGGDCGITDIAGCVTQAITTVFTEIVTIALVPVLELLGQTVLSTPTLEQLPGVSDLWNSNWQIVLGCYVLFIIVAGILLMAHESVQSRYSLKEIAPRIVVGFIASALSLFVADKAIEVANALTLAVLGQGVAPSRLGDTIQADMAGFEAGNLFVILIGLALLVVGFGLLVVYVIRVIITIILIISAPLFLMCHALPATESIARWWWRSFTLVLAIQVAQSLALVVAIRTVLTGGVRLFSSPITSLGLMIVALAVVWILFKIPFWLLRSARGGGGHRSLVGSFVRAVVAYKTFGLLGGSSATLGRRLGTNLAKGFGSRPGSGGSLLAGGRRPRPAGNGPAGMATPASASQRGRWSRRSGRWGHPGPGMLPLTLQQPSGASTGGRARQTLAEQLHDPTRRMPWQQPGDPNAPDLFSPQGGVRRHARSVPVRHPLIPHQPGMLPLTLRHADPIRSRRPVGDEARPSTGAGMRPSAAGLFTSSGRVNPQARPPRVQRPLSPPQPGMLPFTVRPANPVRSRNLIGDESPAPHRGKPASQPGLFMPDGRVNRNALPLKPKRRPKSTRRTPPGNGQRMASPPQRAGQPPGRPPEPEPGSPAGRGQ